MNDFISTVRTDRKREMIEKKTNGIAISNEHQYRIVDTIEVLTNESDKLSFGFQADNDDVYFFLVDGGANSYYSIIEIYELLRYICESGNEEIVIEVLNEIKNTEMKKKKNEDSPEKKGEELWENRTYFIYRGIKYYMKSVKYPEYDKEVEMPDGACKISYLKLFVLVNLIQEKSNALFLRGEGKNKQYVNGIVRLLLCLLTMRKDCSGLRKKGWCYDNESDSFVMHPDIAEDKMTKYYLTEDEYIGIIRTES